MSSRTDEVRGKGRERGGASGGGAPFVRWGDKYAWLEGEMVGSFDTKYGLAVTLKVTNMGGAKLEYQGKDEEGTEYSGAVEVGQEVNVGTQPATLREKIVADDKGKSFHIAMEGWEQGKANKYRVFTVVELTEREPAATAAGISGAPDPWVGPEPKDTNDYSQDEKDLPF